MGLTAKKVYAILNGKIQKVSESVASLGTAIVYKGDVLDESSLPPNPNVGDMYNIISESSYGEPGMNVAWNGSAWDPMGPTIDLSALKVPNPQKLIFSGAVEAEYDGSEEKNVNIPTTDNFLPLSGGAMTGNIEMNGNTISGIPLPETDNETANKAYVDLYTGGIKFSINKERNCLVATYGED